MKSLKQLRESVGISQAELGRLLGVSQDLVYNWEKGRSRPGLPLTPKYAEILGVSLDDIVSIIMNQALPGSKPTPWHKTFVQKKQSNQQLDPVPTTTEPPDPSATYANNPALDEIMDNLQQMSQEDIENFRRLTRSVVNRKTEGVS